MSVPFVEELKTWGPECPAGRPLSLAEAERYCRRLATTHYENFPVASWLLPHELHQHFYNVYAFCRWADDLADEVGDPVRSLDLLAWWRGQVSLCYDGRPEHPVFIALEQTIRQFDIPAEPFTDLISAFEQDQTTPTYETFTQLLDYCRRSANPVGRLVLYLCRRATDDNFMWSDAICTGLQLVNFWQDVARDLEIGRVYLPREDCRRFGYAQEDLSGRVTNAAFIELMKFEVDRARHYLSPWKNDTHTELRGFPFRLQVEIELFAGGGLKVLEKIETIGYCVWERRPVVTKFDIGSLATRCVLRALRRRCGL